MDFFELIPKAQIKTFSRGLLSAAREYFFRTEVIGIENIPKKSGALILPNHSGFSGMDAVMLTFVIKRETKRRARLLAHRAYFDYSNNLKNVAESFGLKKASIENGITVLKKDQLLIIFPEGESGNFKSSLKRYSLQKFHTGFLRMALETKKPIVPTLIIGAEETNLNIGNFDFSKIVKGLRIPMPLNMLPLPAKWKIVFLPPIDPTTEDFLKIKTKKQFELKAEKIRKYHQRFLNKQLTKRTYIYSKLTGKMKDSVAELLK